MNLKELVTGVQGDKQFLLGNEAAVRGVIEAGVSIAATYPNSIIRNWKRIICIG